MAVDPDKAVKGCTTIFAVVVIGGATLSGLGYLGVGCMAGSLTGSDCGAGEGVLAVGVVVAGVAVMVLALRWINRNL